MGNRVKGRVKRKGVKAAKSSDMGSKRKLSRMGKVQKKDHSGLDATFIGRSKCLKKLQVSLKDFRRLCILKGVYPREPRGRTPGNKKGQVYYHVKDIRAIAHEPILEKFREFKTFMKKVRKAAGRNEKNEAARMDSLAPTYTLHHVVRERYPRFADALSDIDDALSLVYLFAALPSQGRIKTAITNKAKSLSAAWGAFCSTTSAITKSFVSVKGIYFEANIQNCTIRWVIPHAFTQNMPNDVDFRVMLTYFEFYETLMGFVLFKLYSDIGIRYPMSITSVDKSNSSTILAANLHALSREARASRTSVSNVVSEAEQATSNQMDIEKKDTAGDKSNKFIKSVDAAALEKIAGQEDSDEDESDVDDSDVEKDDEIGAPLKAALEVLAEEEEAIVGGGAVLDDESTKRRRLFAGLTFFLSREVPRGYLELVCLTYGGKVGWDGDDSPISVKDPSITHHIVDRPKIPASYGSLPKSREYIQPQWILDCANFRLLLPCQKYLVGVELPPHLSPWVNDEEEGYKPAYAEEIERLRNGETLETIESKTEDENSKTESSDSDSDDENIETKVQVPDEDDDEDDESEEEEEDEEKTQRRAQKRKLEEEEEAKTLAKTMMSKKASRLYGRMQHGIELKESKIEKLVKKRKELEKLEKLRRHREEIELTKKGKTDDGKTMQKAKVERLKAERKVIENDYKNTGGSMKKRRKK